MHSANWNTTGICVEFWRGFHHPCSSSSSNWLNVVCKTTLQVQNRLLFWGFVNPTSSSMTNAKVRTTKDRSREMLGQDCSRRNNLQGQISTEMSLQFHPELICGQDHLYMCWFLQIRLWCGTDIENQLDEANTEEVWDYSTNCRCVSRFIGSLWDLPIILLL